MLLDQRVTDAMCNGVSVCTHPIAAMGMGEHVGMVSKAYLLPLGGIIVQTNISARKGSASEAVCQ